MYTMLDTNALYCCLVEDGSKDEEARDHEEWDGSSSHFEVSPVAVAGQRGAGCRSIRGFLGSIRL